MEEIVREEGHLRRRFALQCYNSPYGGCQVRLVVPEAEVPEGKIGITFYKPVDGVLLFRIHPEGRRKLNRASVTARCYSAAIPASVGREMGLPSGTHDIEPRRVEPGLYAINVKRDQ